MIIIVISILNFVHSGIRGLPYEHWLVFTCLWCKSSPSGPEVQCSSSKTMHFSITLNALTVKFILHNPSVQITFLKWFSENRLSSQGRSSSFYCQFNPMQLIHSVMKQYCSIHKHNIKVQWDYTELLKSSLRQYKTLTLKQYGIFLF